MNIQLRFTFKQHLKYFVLSLLVSGVCFYLDVKNDNFVHGYSILSHTTTTKSGTLFRSSYEVAHNTSAAIEIK